MLESGHQPILFPTLEVKPLDGAPLHAHYDAVIFISANAVEYGVDMLKTLNLKGAQIFAVGGATAKCIVQQGFKVDAFPQNNASSEALLALEAVAQLKNQRILIFRGKGGRETLKEGLSKQNNQIEYVEVYERVECKATQLHRDSLLRLSNNQDFIITITSVESLSAMMNLIREVDINLLNKLLKAPLITLSDRIGVFAKSVDFSQIYVAEEPNDSAIVAKIQQIKLEKYNTLDKLK
ncbi:MAG: uroporphyrinogen-III synthase [Gammaproteobacteria bacterium]|nr:uroporphyrinogen-III synthase [Gammaproteobacteria bacterium]